MWVPETTTLGYGNSRKPVDRNVASGNCRRYVVPAPKVNESSIIAGSSVAGDVKLMVYVDVLPAQALVIVTVPLQVCCR